MVPARQTGRKDGAGRTITVILVNITKEPAERQAVAHVQFTGEDLLALHKRLLTGLTNKANELEALKTRVTEASQRLYRIYDSLPGPDPECDPEQRVTDLEKQLAELADEIGTLASDLDDRQSFPKADWR